MLTYSYEYNKQAFLKSLFESKLDAAKYASDVLKPGNLIRPRFSLLALPLESPIPGTSLGRPKTHLHFMTEAILLVVKKPTWCHCQQHYEKSAKRGSWALNHLGYASLILLSGDKLYESVIAVQKDEGIGRSLLKYTTEEKLSKHPGLVFIPLIEPAKI